MSPLSLSFSILFGLLVSSSAGDNVAAAAAAVYSPVELAQLCAEKSGYCIYVDQSKPGIVRASPFEATDNRESSFPLALLF